MRGAPKPGGHTTEPTHLQPLLRSTRGHRNEKPTHYNQREVFRQVQLEKVCVQQQRCSAAKNI